MRRSTSSPLSSHPMSAKPQVADSISTPPSLPLIVQVGFAGARRLWPEGAAIEADAFESDLARQLQQILQKLPTALGLSPQHFLVGVSQLAAGADLLFSETIAGLGWGQRVMLPQLVDDYLNAQGSRGPDFTPAEQARARALLHSPHLIEQRVVTTAAERDARFEDANLTILAEADVIVCLRRQGQVGQTGGTQHLINRARARGVKLLDLCVSVSAEGLPILTQTWDATRFVPPTLPASIQASASTLRVDGTAWPDVQAYAAALKAPSSERAGRRRSGFERAAAIIIGTHVVATLLATVVSSITLSSWVITVLIAELLFLAWGLFRHLKLHHDKHTADWAQARLCAELARSVLAVGRLPTSLGHLLALPVPHELRPVLRTLNVLQLRQIHRDPQPADWEAERKRYMNERIGRAGDQQNPGQGQLGYYGRHQSRAATWVTVAGWSFTVLSGLAIAATAMKLAYKLKWIVVPDDLLAAAGPIAVVAPVLAVGVMSMAAAFDAEARSHTFHDMQAFLLASHQRLANAESPREAAALVAETETRLFGETVLWYARRAYTSVA